MNTRTTNSPGASKSAVFHFRLAPRRTACALLIALAAAATAPAQTHRDLVYGRVGAIELKLDLYVPEGAGPHPLVVWIHGGAWRGGSKENPPGAYLRERGYAMASVSYRLSGAATWPAQIDDCQAAIRWLRTNGSGYGLDTRKIVAWGASAGGHLVAMLGALNAVEGVIDFFGPTDFLRMNDTPGKMDHNAPDSPESQLIGGPIQQNAERVAAANPIKFLSRKSPPFLIVHGDADPLVPLGQSQILKLALNRMGVQADLMVLPKAGHGGPRFEEEDVRNKVIAFVRRIHGR